MSKRRKSDPTGDLIDQIFAAGNAATEPVGYRSGFAFYCPSHPVGQPVFFLVGAAPTCATCGKTI
jgi:hypothetical protein